MNNMDTFFILSPPLFFRILSDKILSLFPILFRPFFGRALSRRGAIENGQINKKTAHYFFGSFCLLKSHLRLETIEKTRHWLNNLSCGKLCSAFAFHRFRHRKNSGRIFLPTPVF